MSTTGDRSAQIADLMARINPTPAPKIEPVAERPWVPNPAATYCARCGVSTLPDMIAGQDEVDQYGFKTHPVCRDCIANHSTAFGPVRTLSILKDAAEPGSLRDDISLNQLVADALSIPPFLFAQKYGAVRGGTQFRWQRTREEGTLNSVVARVNEAQVAYNATKSKGRSSTGQRCAGCGVSDAIWIVKQRYPEDINDYWDEVLVIGINTPRLPACSVCADAYLKNDRVWVSPRLNANLLAYATGTTDGAGHWADLTGVRASGFELFINTPAARDPKAHEGNHAAWSHLPNRDAIKDAVKRALRPGGDA